MGRKIFVSYKYADSTVQRLNSNQWWEATTVRDYVDKLETFFNKSSDHIYKGESNNEDLSSLCEDSIWEKLKDRIYDSSTTIIMISPRMKEPNRSEKSQWIPWEISFSLKETTRNDYTSHSNAMLAVVLPDCNGSYDYFMSREPCDVTAYKIDTLFPILKANMFNIKNPYRTKCDGCGGYHYHGEFSYIEAVRWEDFIAFPNRYIDKAHERKEHIDDYEIQKNFDCYA